MHSLFVSQPDVDMRHFQSETEIASLNRKLRLLEDELERSQTQLNTATERLNELGKVADESDR
jgi:uncharacterized coiled-coil protein SlyX